MVYRNDSDALQARLEVIEKDLAERTRERDEVARMLAEARAVDHAVTWLADAPRRRRRRLIVAVSLAVATVAAFATYRIRHHRDDFEETIQEFSKFRDEACRCVDKTCAEDVTNRMTTWGTEMQKDGRADLPPHPAEMQRVADISKQFADCMTRAMTAEPPSAANQQ